MNVRDSEVICGLLKKEGYGLVNEPDKADIILLNTCSVREHAEDKVWSEIGRIGKLSPLDFVQKTHKIKTGETPRPTNKIVGLVGCMAQAYKQKVFDRAPNVNFVVGPSDIDKIPGIINRLSTTKIRETEGTIRPEDIYHTGFYEKRNNTYVVVSEGCSNYCSYCVVPYVRGDLKNRNHKDIIREVEEAVGKGITKITLLGQNVNAYLSKVISSQPSVNFIELLKLVNQIEGIEEFSFITSHPKDTSVELFRVMASLGKLKKSLHLPIQSGSDRILAMMNRGYTKKFYLELVTNYRKIVKDSVLSTDIIVGYPQETDKDFQETFDLVKDIEFDAAYIFKYSARPNTKAAELADDLPRAVKEKRHKIILDLQKGISKKKRC
ncbi:MAG: tRNA (N6-isopentenyl adenosine(37)-C2)-methylthiotransferase MiaB [Candidatus Omnitrophica bacterium]|nr:tRNA (N6-isopentenyl adenosine(37)-C2)-methylthiotransferase MiaB [Candidatus Omnitrophota bacterium]